MAYQNSNPFPKPGSGKFERKEGTGSAWKNDEYDQNMEDSDPNNYYAQGKLKVGGKEWNIRIYVNKPDPEKPKRPQFNLWANDPETAPGHDNTQAQDNPDNLPF